MIKSTPTTQLTNFLLPMPQLACFCKFAECDGTFVDSKTFDRHKRHDLSKHVRDAIATATTTCKNQDDAIAEHLASLSLSFDCPNDSTAPLHQPTTSSSRFSGKSTDQKQIEKLLYQLCDIEILLEDLTTSVHGKLDGMGTPGTANDTFPLLSSISTARTIRSQLSSMGGTHPESQVISPGALRRSGYKT